MNQLLSSGPFHFFFILFFTSIYVYRLAKPCIVLREKLKREERCEIRFTSAGKSLQELKSQHILKKSSSIDKLSIVLLPGSKRLYSKLQVFQTSLRWFSLPL